MKAATDELTHAIDRARKQLKAEQDMLAEYESRAEQSRIMIGLLDGQLRELEDGLAHLSWAEVEA